MSDDQTARLGLPYLAAGQMQKHVTLNEALTRLDALVQTAAASRTLQTQPADPADGVLYILPGGATGPAWSGQAEGALMRFEAGGWSVVDVPDGAVVLIADAGQLVLRDGGSWIPLGERLQTLQNLNRFGLGATADAANPFAARLNKALWTAVGAGEGGDGDLRVTFNKEGAPDVLSLLFQSGWSGRAELGLVGDDDLRLKVSDDGSIWREAWSVDRASGQVSFGLGATRRTVTVMDADGGYAVPAWARAIEIQAVGGGGGGGAGAFGLSGPRFGGGGGGAGGVSRCVLPASEVSAGLTVVVGAGGGGGVAGAGLAGGETTVALGSTVLLTAGGGGGGGPGDASQGLAGAAGPGTPDANRGGASSVTAAGEDGAGFERPDASGGGGAGGGLDETDTAYGGGAGGDGGVLAVTAAGGAGGSGGPGGGGAPAPLPTLCWAGGGGGGGGSASTGSGHDGGDGGFVGGGGGGGGAGIAGGGGGGAGAAGVVWLIAVG